VGLATASLLARSNQRVILMDLQSVDAQVERLRAEGAEAVGISGDISSEPFVERAVRQMHDDFGAMDGLVNNAGISLISPAEETSAEQWRRVLDVNLFGPFLLCKHLGRPMLERGRGSIVNVASVAGLAGVIHRSAYNASKHGLVGLTRTLAANGADAACASMRCVRVDQDGNGSADQAAAPIRTRTSSIAFPWRDSRGWTMWRRPSRSSWTRRGAASSTA